ncbi:MAG: hypothetical protein A2Y40_06560 [Candidatus Margulisbacteria bacterium GWF2_35_9]|nr:MAG: hypothetical protein A2Y40_06560 [Candidatus Margulisbacteria bacterium GWF2_35_9]
MASLRSKGVISYKNELTLQETIDAFQKLRNMGFSMVSFGGAEPTEKEEFGEIALSLHNQGYTLKIHTNGTNINDESALIYKQCEFFEVRISLDGSNEEVNDFIRGDSTYKKIIKGIKKGIEYGLPITIAVTISKYNVDDLPNIIDLAKELDVKAVHSYLLIDKGRGIDLTDYLPDDNDKRKAKKIFQDKANQYHGIAKIANDNLPCAAGACYLELKQDGSINLYEDSHAYFSVGVSTIGNIFDQDIETKIKDALVNKKIPDCNNCKYYGNSLCPELDNYCFADIKFF